MARAAVLISLHGLDMTVLFSYCIVHDSGAAPNPFWGICTLVICKPVIRCIAQAGDWIVGTGSANSPIGDIRGKVVYAMQVTGKMPMHQYDTYAEEYLPNKIPRWCGGDPRLMVGDSIYDFSYDPPRVRRSVHDENDRDHDLSRQYALLSEHFFYFGDQPREAPDHLRGLVKCGPGHRSRANDKYLEPFLEWLDGLGLAPNQLYGKPQGRIFRGWERGQVAKAKCDARCKRGSENDQPEEA